MHLIFRLLKTESEACFANLNIACDVYHSPALPDYHFFISQNEVDEMKKNAEFLENAKVFDHNYGTPKKMVEEEIKKGNCVLFDIDWQGARQIKEKSDRDSVVLIFILPPSMQELERRLRARASDPEEIVQDRMKKARSEISHYDEYDFILINDDLNATYQKIRSIIEAKRVARQNRDDIKKSKKHFSTTDLLKKIKITLFKKEGGTARSAMTGDFCE